MSTTYESLSYQKGETITVFNTHNGNIWRWGPRPTTRLVMVTKDIPTEKVKIHSEHGTFELKVKDADRTNEPINKLWF